MNDISAKIDTNTFRRVEKISYPKIAIREILVNSICHADYFIRSNIKIEFFNDRLKFTNPGGVFDATLEDVLNGTQTYRNPKLVHIFDKLELIENFGTGITRTFEVYSKYNVKPLFEATENFFYVTLPNLNQRDFDPINDPINDSINDPINEDSLLILRIIKNNPGIKVKEIHNLLIKENPKITIDIIKNNIKRYLTKYVEFKGPNKTGGYYLLESLAK